MLKLTQQAKKLQQTPRKKNHALSENLNKNWGTIVKKRIFDAQLYTTTYSKQKREIQAALLNDEKNWIQTGLTGKYAIVKAERTKLIEALEEKYGEDNNPRELFSSDQDHLNPDCVRELLEISLPEGLCINSWNVFNRNREYAKKGKIAYARADELRGCDLRDIAGEMYFASLNGARERTQNTTKPEEKNY